MKMGTEIYSFPFTCFSGIPREWQQFTINHVHFPTPVSVAYPENDNSSLSIMFISLHLFQWHTQRMTTVHYQSCSFPYTCFSGIPREWQQFTINHVHFPTPVSVAYPENDNSSLSIIFISLHLFQWHTQRMTTVHYQSCSFPFTCFSGIPREWQQFTINHVHFPSPVSVAYPENDNSSLSIMFISLHLFQWHTQRMTTVHYQSCSFPFTCFSGIPREWQQFTINHVHFPSPVSVAYPENDNSSLSIMFISLHLFQWHTQRMTTVHYQSYSFPYTCFSGIPREWQQFTINHVHFPSPVSVAYPENDNSSLSIMFISLHLFQWHTQRMTTVHYQSCSFPFTCFSGIPREWQQFTINHVHFPSPVSVAYPENDNSSLSIMFISLHLFQWHTQRMTTVHYQSCSFPFTCFSGIPREWQQFTINHVHFPSPVSVAYPENDNSSLSIMFISLHLFQWHTQRMTTVHYQSCSFPFTCFSGIPREWQQFTINHVHFPTPVSVAYPENDNSSLSIMFISLHLFQWHTQRMTTVHYQSCSFPFTCFSGIPREWQQFTINHVHFPSPVSVAYPENDNSSLSIMFISLHLFQWHTQRMTTVHYQSCSFPFTCFSGIPREWQQFTINHVHFPSPVSVAYPENDNSSLSIMFISLHLFQWHTQRMTTVHYQSCSFPFTCFSGIPREWQQFTINHVHFPSPVSVAYPENDNSSLSIMFISLHLFQWHTQRMTTVHYQSCSFPFTCFSGIPREWQQFTINHVHFPSPVSVAYPENDNSSLSIMFISLHLFQWHTQRMTTVHYQSCSFPFTCFSGIPREWQQFTINHVHFPSPVSVAYPENDNSSLSIMFISLHLFQWHTQRMTTVHYQSCSFPFTCFSGIPREWQQFTINHVHFPSPVSVAYPENDNSSLSIMFISLHLFQWHTQRMTTVHYQSCSFPFTCFSGIPREWQQFTINHVHFPSPVSVAYPENDNSSLSIMFISLHLFQWHTQRMTTVHYQSCSFPFTCFSGIPREWQQFTINHIHFPSPVSAAYPENDNSSLSIMSTFAHTQQLYTFALSSNSTLGWLQYNYILLLYLVIPLLAGYNTTIYFCFI